MTVTGMDSEEEERDCVWVAEAWAQLLKSSAAPVRAEHKAYFNV